MSNTKRKPNLEEMVKSPKSQNKNRQRKLKNNSTKVYEDLIIQMSQIP